MYFSVAEAALAVGKAEGYVRQHIRRGHLESELINGERRVAVDALLRWAEERNLVVDREVLGGVPARAADAVARVARVAVLTLVDGDRRINLLSTIRHRRGELVGPWRKTAAGQWRITTLAGPLELLVADFDGDDWLGALQSMRTGSLTADSRTIEYAVERAPTEHFGGRDHTFSEAPAVASPFSHHSAEITEFWNFDDQLRAHWLALRDSVKDQLRPLGLDLHKLTDRVGNVLVFAALDEITCSFGAGRDGILRFSAHAPEAFAPGDYRAVVWAYQGEDLVLRHEMPVSSGDTDLEVDADIDRLGFALYRGSDGRCIDYSDAYLIRGFRISMGLVGPELVLQDRRKREFHRTRRVSSSLVTVSSEERSERDSRIRARRLERLADVQELRARAQGNLFRFDPDQFTQAVAQLIEFIGESAGSNEPVYLADGYFIAKDLKGDVNAKLRGYIDLFAAAGGRPLRILCTWRQPAIPPWFGPLLPFIGANVEIRSVTFKRSRDDSEPAPGFHDRFLITPRREVLISNSFNGWTAHGVTFVTCPYGVYRAEAERLWGRPLGGEVGLCVHRIVP